MTEGINQQDSLEDIDRLLAEQGYDIEQKKKKGKSRKKALDNAIERLENQIKKLEDDGTSNFQDESSLAPSNLLKRGLISHAPSHRGSHHPNPKRLD